jgi:hypothetical protein
MPATFQAFVEDPKGNVIGYAVANGPDILLSAEDRFPRRLQKTKAEETATKCGVDLPANLKTSLKAMPDPVEDPKTAEPGLE